MKKFSPLSLSILSGIFLWASWPVSSLTIFIFIAFIPLLFLADITEKRLHFFLYCFITMLIWNAATTWWIWNASPPGAVAAIVANSLFMTLPWWGYRLFKRKFSQRIGYASLIIFWMSFEYIYLNIQLSWPWLTLGNVFAMHPSWVQWYEFTGTSGGTLLILLINILLFELLKKWKTQNVKNKIKYTSVLIAVVIIPFAISEIISHKIIEPASSNTNVIIVQPNIDPYNEKFDAATLSSQIQLLVSLSQSQLDSNTRLVVWPETALSALDVFQDKVSNFQPYQPVFQFINNHPNITLLSGIEIWKNYGSTKETPSAILNENDNNYYDDFNAAVSIKAAQPLEFYDKSKLVPGVESLPDFLQWMGPVFEKFGGTAGGYGRSKESEVFQEPNNPYITAPIICYESIYGEYVASYVRKGANLLTIITNDGWWGNTPGYQQHLQYARLRAIETRRWVIRSANTGMSAVIDAKGNILQTQPWDKATFIKATIPIETSETFFVKYGDILSRSTLLLACFFIIMNIYLIIKKKFF